MYHRVASSIEEMESIRNFVIRKFPSVTRDDMFIDRDKYGEGGEKKGEKQDTQNDCVKTNFINHVTAIDDAICTSSEFRESYNRALVAGRKIA